MSAGKRVFLVLASVLLLAGCFLSFLDITSAPLAASYSCIIVLFVIIMQENQRRTVRRIQNRKKRGRTSTMRQLIERFIGKEVSVASIVGTLRGVLTELSENAVLIECKGNVQVINVDYIYSVKEVKPKKK
ncbi:MAG: hypothetical protein IJF38_01285 [Clostridia bacterium]|nr:hypothetical protein [Clostridia bacterium]